MTGKGTMKLLTALMSAFLAAGVLCGAQLDAAAADEVQEATFSEPEEPVQVDVTPAITTDGKAFTWTSLENDDYSANARYDMDGVRYVEGTLHEFAVSTDPDATMGELIRLDDGADLRDVDDTITGTVTIDHIITDMIVKDLNDNNEVFSTGYYYLYVCGDNKFSKPSASTFSFTAVAEGGREPAAEWYCYERNYVKKVIDEGTVDSPTAWHYDFYETAEGEEWPEICPAGYEEKENYKVMITDDAIGDDTVTGFIVEPVGTGSFLDRNGSQQVVLHRGEGDVQGATSTHILIDSFEGLTVKAIRRNGTISPAAPVTKMAPWKAWDPQNTVALDNDVTVDDATGRASFLAPDFTKDLDTWHDDMGTENPVDDRDYVNGFGYRVYVNKQDAASDVSRYAELFVENETVREIVGNTTVDTSYIWRNSVLIEMNNLYINKGVLFEDGTYDVYAVAGYNRKDYYYSNPFQVVFTPPTGEAGNHEIFYNSHPVWIRNTEQGIEEYERQENEDDDAVRAKMQTQGYEDYYEMKRAELFVDDTATGYIVNTGETARILFWDGSYSDTWTIPVNDGHGSTSFMVSPDFKINDDSVTITRITPGAKKKVKAKRWHWYDNDLQKSINDLEYDPMNDQYSFTPLADTVIERTDEENNIYYDFAPGYYYNLYISCLDDPDASQDMDWYNWMLQPQARDCVTIDKDTLITQLVRDKIEAELTGGERGNSELIPGNYAITVVAGTYDENDPDAGGPVARSNEIVIDLSNMAAPNAIDDIPEALYTNGKDHFRAAGEGYDRHWQSISDYYRDEDNPDGNVYRDNEGNLIDFRELDEDVQEAYIAAVNAGLPEDERFVEKDTLNAYLLSSRGYDDNVAGYIVRLVDNRFTYNDMGDGAVMDSRVKGEEEEMWHNRETGMGGILERPVTDGKLLVVAIYWDGSISDWQYGRERHYWDEFTRENEEILLRNTDGTINWNQTDNGGREIFIERVSDGIWFRVDVGRTLKYDPESNKGSFELGDLLLWMVSAKFQGWYDGENNTYVKENLINGLYRIRILRHPVADGEFDRVSKDDLRFNFDTSADRPAAFRANYNDRTKYVKVVQDGNGQDTWYRYETYDEPGEGRTEKKEYTIGIKDNDANIVGYIINLPDCDIMDVNREGSLRYSAVLAGNGKENDNSGYTTKEWLFHDKDNSSEILIASVNADGTMSEWVSAVPSSRADEFETAVMGLNYNAVNGLFDADKVSLNALNASLSRYSKEGEEPDGDGYTPVAEAAVVFRGVEEYDAGTRLYRKNVNDYRIDSVNLPARAAADELMFAEGQKNIWDDENVHHEEPWRCLPGPGTYKAALVIWPQNGHDGATGLASDGEVSFTYRKGLDVETPVAGSVTYSRDTNGNYNVHVTSPADDAVAYIVKYKRNSNDTMFTYEDRVADEYGNFGGGFGDGGRIYVCAVNRYGDISGFTEVLPEIESVAENTLNTENCNKIYPVGFGGFFTLSGARVTAKRYDTETSESVDIYELAERTGGKIKYMVGDSEVELSGTDFAQAKEELSVQLRLYGGRLNGYHDDICKNLGTVALQVKALAITSITENISIDKNSYFVGDIPVIVAGSQVVITYDDGSTRVIIAPDSALSLFSANLNGEGILQGSAGEISIEVYLDGQILLKKTSAGDAGSPVVFNVPLNAVTTESITVTPPYKTTYFVGESAFDPDGGIVTVTKNNGKTEAKPLDVNWCEGFDYTTPGSKTITVHLDDKTATFTVNFVEPAVTGIRVFALPKLSYIEGEAFDPTGGILTVSKEYEYGGPVVVDMSNQGVTIPDIRSLPPGDHEISIGYSGKTTTLNITISAKKVNTVEFITRPDKSEYQPGEELDLTGGKIRVTYNDGVSSDELDLPDIADELAISGFRNDVPGLYTVSVVYKGKTVTFDASVKGVIKLELTQAPAKLSYYAGQGLVPAGGKITAYFEDGSQVTMDITGNMLSGYDKNAPGRQTVKVTYGGRVVTFDVDVIAVAVDRIAVAPAPSKTEYICGEDLSVAGGKIRVTYNDGHEETIDITAAMVSGYDKDKEGAQTITVTYSGKTATFAVTVKPAEKPVPVVTTAPAAVTGLVADGTAKALITAGEATGGMLYYAVTAEDAAPAAEAYAKTIPTGTAAGTYYVWYFVKGADGYSDTEAVKLTVTIAAPADNPEPAVHKHSLKKHDRVEPTYDQAGSIEYWECTDPACKKIFADAAGTKEITAVETILPRLLDYVNIPAETVPVVEEGTINDKPVKIETDVTYPGAVTWTGGKTTRDQLSVLAGNSQIARVSITGLEEAISKMKPGTDTGKLFTISYNIKGKAIGQGSFTITIKLNSKALKKAGIKGNDKKALVELVKSLNEQLAKDVHTFEIVPIDLSDTQNVTITVKAKLKGGKVQVNEADNSIKKLSKLTITYKVPAGWKKGVLKTKKKTFTYKPSKVTGKFVITVTDPVARTADIIATADNTTFAGGRIGLTVKK